MHADLDAPLISGIGSAPRTAPSIDTCTEDVRAEVGRGGGGGGEEQLHKLY